MRPKNLLILIIVAVIAVICVATAYVVTDHTSYSNLTLNGMKCEVPNNNITPLVDNPEYQTYNDPKCNLTIMVFTNTSNYTPPVKKNNNTTVEQNLTLQEQQFIKVKSQCQYNVTQITEDNVTFNKSSNGMYSYYSCNNNTNESILIKTNNKNVLVHILKTLQLDPSIRVDGNNTVNMTDNSTNTTTTTVKSQPTTTKSSPQITASSKSSSSKSESTSKSNSGSSGSSSSSSHKNSGSSSSSSSSGSSGGSSGGSQSSSSGGSSE